MKHNLKTGLLIFIIFLLVPVCMAKEAGYLMVLKGQVIVHSKNKEEIFKESDERITIYERDKIHAGEDSKAEFMFKSKKESVKIYSKTFLVIKSAKNYGSELILPLGKARFVVSPKSRKRKRFVVRTSNAILGVKGTDFIVQTDGDLTDVLTINGKVSFANLAYLKKKIFVRKNQASRTTRDEPPADVVTVPVDIQKKIIIQADPELWDDIDLENVTQPIKSTRSTGPKKIDPVEVKKVNDNLKSIKKQVDQSKEVIQQVESQVKDTTKTIKFTITNE